MELRLISAYRSQLMGVAIIWVMLYHYFGKADPILTKNLFFAIGHGGVDIFLFLSGFGLVFSCFKGGGEINYKEFIKKRFLRIIPTYYIVIIFFGIILSISAIEIFQQILIFGFFLPMFKISFYDWYIPSLMLLYLIFPFYYRSFIKKPEVITILSVLTGIILTVLLIYIQKGTVILFFSRIPVFFIGAYFAYRVLKKENFSKNEFTWLVAFFVAFLVFELAVTYLYDSSFLRKTALSHLPFMFITPGLCLVLSSMFSKIGIGSNFFGEIFFKMLAFLGAISLEVYLIHMTFYRAFNDMPILLAVFITILCAYFLSRVVDFTLKKISNFRSVV